MVRPATSRLLASVGLVATAALFGGNHVVIRAIAGETSPFALVFWRWTLAALVLAVFAAVPLWRARSVLREYTLPIFALGFLNCVLFSAAIIAAPFGTTAANVGLIQATAPLWVVAAGAAFFSRAPDLRGKIGLLLGFAGACALILSENDAEATITGLRWGDAATLIATLLWAAYSLLLRRGPPALHPVLLFGAIVLAGYALLVPMVIAAVLAGVDGSSLLNPPPSLWLAILYVGLGAALLGNLFWNYGVHTLGAELASQFLFLAPVCSIAFGAFWLGEIPSLLGWAGAVSVLTGLSLSGKSVNRKGIVDR